MDGSQGSSPTLEQSLFSDAFILSWDAHLGDSHVSGLWSPQEEKLRINYLEMMAVFLILQSYQQELLGTVVSHVR